MNTKTTFLGICALVTVIALSMTGCKGDESENPEQPRTAERIDFGTGLYTMLSCLV